MGRRIIEYSYFAKSGGVSIPFSFVTPDFGEERDSKRGVVLLIHGDGSSFRRETLAELEREIAYRGYCAASFGFRGVPRWNGIGWTPDNAENYTVGTMIEDAEAALDALALQTGREYFTVVGFGIGAFVAGLLLKNPAVKNAIFAAPKALPDSALDHPFDEKIRGMLAENKLGNSRVLEELGEFRGPFLVLGEGVHEDILWRFFESAPETNRAIRFVDNDYGNAQSFTKLKIAPLADLILERIATADGGSADRVEAI